MTLRRPFVPLALAAALFPVLVSLLGLANPGSVSADDGARGYLSLDGQVFTDHLEGDLFQPGRAWRPGETRVARFVVQNPADQPTDLELRLDRATSEDRTGGYLQLDARVRGGPWREVVISMASQLVHLEQLAPGEQVPIELRAGLSAVAPPRVDVDEADLTFDIDVLSSSLDPADDLVASRDADEGASSLVLAPVFLLAGMVVALVVAWRMRRHRY